MFKYLVIIILLTTALFAADTFVTVYNQNLALIKEVRNINIESEDAPVYYPDVASAIIPATVRIRSLDNPKSFKVLEQNYEYDLVSADKILEKYIDHQVELVLEDGTIITGKLLSQAGRHIVIKTDNGIKLVPFSDDLMVQVKDLPEGLITRPTLVWHLAGTGKGKETVEVSYLTRGMTWRAEYVGVLNENDSRLSLDSWVSIKNESGAAFKDANLKLVAGDIHLVQQPPENLYFSRRERVDAFAAKAAAAGFAERQFFEYHIYELGRKTTLKQMQEKQITLYPPATVGCTKKFYYDAVKDAENILIGIEFKNDEKSGLGKPLPAGIVRIYKQDKEGMEFVGEDRIEHTPRKEDVKLSIGKAFDLKAERVVKDRKNISKRGRRDNVEIELRNNKKDQDVVITVVEHVNYPEWKVESSNFQFRKVSANKIEFDIPVAKDSKTTLQYTIKYSW